MDKHWVATDFGDLDVLEFRETEVRAPGIGEVTIDVRASGVNPADFKHISRPSDRQLPIPIGYEASGIISAIGPQTGFQLGDAVLGFRFRGAYATALTVPASDVFMKPPSLGFPEAANLLLAGTTATEMLHLTHAGPGDTVLIHGASGAVGVSAIQQAVFVGARVIGTASEKNFPLLERFGAEPVRYGEGLADRVRALAPHGITVALDTVGTKEAVQVSLELVADRSRIVTLTASDDAEREGFHIIAGAVPSSASAQYRNSVRATLVDLAGRGKLVVPIATTFPLADAIEALRLVKTGHPGGKVALIP
ncbi:MAG: NADP-dependent oxidoreductase [Lacisediminihabitans sp.]